MNQLVSLNYCELPDPDPSPPRPLQTPIERCQTLTFFATLPRDFRRHDDDAPSVRSGEVNRQLLRHAFKPLHLASLFRMGQTENEPAAGRKLGGPTAPGLKARAGRLAMQDIGNNLPLLNRDARGKVGAVALTRVGLTPFLL